MLLIPATLGDTIGAGGGSLLQEFDLRVPGLLPILTSQITVQHVTCQPSYAASQMRIWTLTFERTEINIKFI